MADPLAAASLVALLAAVALSGASRLNPGLAGLTLAWLLGMAAGETASQTAARFPAPLFLTLTGVTLLFGTARVNGTLARLIEPLARAARARPVWLGPAFFVLAAAMSAAGVGNIGATALLAPVALAAARETGLGSFAMSLMIVNGANAGAFSPFAYTGAIANGLAARQGLALSPWRDVFLPSFLAQTAVAAAAYLIFGRRGNGRTGAAADPGAWTPAQRATAAALAAFVAGVAGFGLDVGFWALTLAAGLLVGGAAPPAKAVGAVAWDAILMTCGMSLLVSCVQARGGLDLLTAGVARWSGTATSAGALALLAGVASVWSSSSGVVMPSLIPLVPGLVAAMGGGDPAALVTAVNVGSHLVDASPLSTLGALCVAAAAPGEDEKNLFRRLLAWGFAMSLVGAVVCHLLFDRR